MIHKTQLIVRYAETDMMGIVHHSNYPVWAEYARTTLLKDTGVPYSQIEKIGVMLPVTEMCFQFRSPAYFEDLITIESAIVHLDNRRLKLAYKIYREENTLCVEGFTKHIFMSAETRRSLRVSDQDLEKYRIYTQPDFEKNKKWE